MAKKLTRYMVWGTWCEVSASVHCWAKSRKDALKKLYAVHGDKLKGLDITVWSELEGGKAFMRHWKGERASYHGMYRWGTFSDGF